MKQLRIQPSKPASILGMMVGGIFVGAGITLLCYVVATEVPWFIKGFIALWTLGAAGLTLYHCLNVFSARGVASEIIEIDDPPRRHR